MFVPTSTVSTTTTTAPLHVFETGSGDVGTAPVREQQETRSEEEEEDQHDRTVPEDADRDQQSPPLPRRKTLIPIVRFTRVKTTAPALPPLSAYDIVGRQVGKGEVLAENNRTRADGEHERDLGDGDSQRANLENPTVQSYNGTTVPDPPQPSVDYLPLDYDYDGRNDTNGAAYTLLGGGDRDDSRDNKNPAPEVIRIGDDDGVEPDDVEDDEEEEEQEDHDQREFVLGGEAKKDLEVPDYKKVADDDELENATTRSFLLGSGEPQVLTGVRGGARGFDGVT